MSDILSPVSRLDTYLYELCINKNINEKIYTDEEVDNNFQTKTQILTQEEYDALVVAGTVDTNTTYLIKSDF